MKSAPRGVSKNVKNYVKIVFEWCLKFMLLFEPFEGLSWSPFGCPWGALGGPKRALGRALGASLGQLGANLSQVWAKLA